MESKKIKTKILPFLVIALMLLASIVVIGGASEAKEVKAYGYNGSILYIYKDNKTLLNEWETYLNNIGYKVDFLQMDTLGSVEYNNYDLIIIGNDSVAISSSDRKIMFMSNVPILGVGEGGVYFYMYSEFGGGYYLTSTTDILEVKKNLIVYTEPNAISGVPGNLQIYSTASYRIYVFDTQQLPYEKTFSMGYLAGNDRYTQFFQRDQFMFWGFTQSPNYLTSDGDKLLQNAIYYMVSNNNFNIYVPHVQNRITFDGQIGFFEWFGAHFVYPDSTYANYTAFFEDESNIYILINFKNMTSDYDYMTLWFERDNNRTSGVDKSVFYVILKEHYGVKYREVINYNTWGTFNDTDGTNIDAKWNYASDYDTAEIRISKNYLGITGNQRGIMGFGIQYHINNNLINYPASFNWNNATTAISLYSQNHWKGQYEHVSAPRGSTPILDGVYDYKEWHSASINSLPTYYNEATLIRFMHDTQKLYVGGFWSNGTASTSSIYLYFDVNGDGGTTPQTDDFEIWGGRNGNTFYANEHYGTGSDWGTSQPLTNATIKFTMSGNYIYFELAINFSKLNIYPGSYKEIRMSIDYSINNHPYLIPTERQHTVPDTWNITLYSPSYWGDNKLNLDAKVGSPVNIDGTIDSHEWDDSYIYYFKEYTGKTISMYVKNDESHLLLAFYYPTPTESSSTFIDLGFDVGYDHSGAPQSGDFAIRITYTNQTVEWHGSGGNWVGATPSGWTRAIDNTTDKWTVEISIDYTKLGLIPGVDSRIGFILYFSDDGNGYFTEPMGGNFTNLGTWSTIESSDAWGETVVPEFNAMLLTAMLAIFVPAIVIWKRRH